jgi:hypothetical protein
MENQTATFSRPCSVRPVDSRPHASVRTAQLADRMTRPCRMGVPRGQLCIYIAKEARQGGSIVWTTGVLRQATVKVLKREKLSASRDLSRSADPQIGFAEPGLTAPRAYPAGNPQTRNPPPATLWVASLRMAAVAYCLADRRFPRLLSRVEIRCHSLHSLSRSLRASGRLDPCRPQAHEAKH